MLTLQRLLALAAAVALTVAVAVVVSNAVQNADPALKSIAAAVFAEKPAKADTPIFIRQYIAYYDGRVLTDRPAGVPVYIAGLGDCPSDVRGLLGRAYTRRDAVIHVGRCSLLMPWVEEGAVTHYVFTCTYGSDFRPEAAELETTHQGRPLKMRIVLVSC